MLVALEIKNFRKFDRYAVHFGKRNLLVGPNNAGKSTLIEALRLVSIVVNRFGSLNFDRPPEWLDGTEPARGVAPSLRGLDFDLGRETFHHYGDPPAVVTARFSGGSSVAVYVGPDSDVFAVVRDADDAVITTKREARLFDQPRIGIQPQVGPVARTERPLADRYVKGSLDSTLAPTHFRNQLRLLDHHFGSFKAAAEDTWPALRVDGVELMGRGDACHLELFVRDGSFVGEVAAMGHGLQMWLQLMWFLSRASGDGTIVLDEPDVYMHPDLQRRLIRFLLARDQQVIVATHSIEMMAEVEPQELVPVDASRSIGRHARDLRDVQKIVEQVGGVHNIEFARLSRARRYLIAPGADLRLIRRFQDVVSPHSGDQLDILPAFPLEGWDDWPYAIAMKRAIDAARVEPATAVCLAPPGLLSDHEIQLRRDEAAREGVDMHVWERRGLLNYLLSPGAIARAARAQTGNAEPSDAELTRRLNAVLDGMTGHVLDEVGPSGRAAAERRWDCLEGKVALVPGRLVLLRMAAWLREHYGCSVGVPDVLRAITSDDLSPELSAVLEALRLEQPVARIRGTVADRVTWAASVVEGDAEQLGGQELDEILGLFEAAGVIDAGGAPVPRD
jgi:energy-coupling factor transporter ATP-binding protein EcfA2